MHGSFRWRQDFSFDDGARRTISFQKPVNRAFEFSNRAPDQIDIMRADNKSFRGVPAANQTTAWNKLPEASTVTKKSPRGPKNQQSSILSRHRSEADVSRTFSKAHARSIVGEVNLFNYKLPEERNLMNKASRLQPKKSFQEEFSDILSLSALLPQGSKMEITHAHIGIDAETDEQPLEMLEGEHLNTTKDYDHEPPRGSVGARGKGLVTSFHFAPDSYRKVQAGGNLLDPILENLDMQHDEDEAQDLKIVYTHSRTAVDQPQQFESGGETITNRSERDARNSNRIGSSEKGINQTQENQLKRSYPITSQTEQQTSIMRTGQIHHRAEAEKRSQNPASLQEQQNIAIPTNEKLLQEKTPAATPIKNKDELASQSYSAKQYSYQPKDDKRITSTQGSSLPQYTPPQPKTGKIDLSVYSSEKTKV